MLEVVDLACERGERRLFNGLNFALQTGELLYVHGANGSGKTTLLRTLCGLALPAAGEVRWNGTEIRRLGDEYNGRMMYIGHLNGIKDELTALDVKSVGRGQSLLGEHLDKGGMVMLTTHQEVEITSRRARHVHLGE